MKKNGKSARSSEDSALDHKLDAAFEHDFESTLAKMRALDHVPEREPARIEAGRKAFITAINNMQPAVSHRPESRLMGWTNIVKKERSPMFTLARIILLAAIALGSTGVTAYAAQESLPDEALYPVKTWIEDARLGLTADPQTDFDLLLSFIEERIVEIEALVQQGDPVPEQVTLRLNNQLQQMANVAADLDNPALLKAMEQVRVRSQVQVQRLEQLRENAPDHAKALGQATQAMHNLRTTAEGALEDPITFRERYGENRPDQAPEFPDNTAPNGSGVGPSDGQGQGPQATRTPKNRNRGGQ